MTTRAASRSTAATQAAVAAAHALGALLLAREAAFDAALSRARRASIGVTVSRAVWRAEASCAPPPTTSPGAEPPTTHATGETR